MATLAALAGTLFLSAAQRVEGGGAVSYRVTIRRATRQSLSPHIGAAAAYDSLRKRVLVFGGANPAAEAETPKLWAFATASGRFSEIQVEGELPRGLAFPSLVYDSVRDCVFVFGGWAKKGDRPNNELWKLDLKDEKLQWSRIAGGDSSPSPRNGSVMVFDRARDRLVLHGGDGGPHPTYGYTPLADLWSLDLKEGKWAELAATGDVPTCRWNHSAALNEVASEMFIFGGTGYIGEGQVVSDNDLFVLDLETLVWTRRKCSAPCPPSLQGASLTLDDRMQSLLLIGGLTDTDAETSGLAHVWIYNLRTRKWFKDRQVFRKYRRDHVGVYDPSARAHLIHGGQTTRNPGDHHQRGQPLTDTLVISVVRR